MTTTTTIAAAINIDMFVSEKRQNEGQKSKASLQQFCRRKVKGFCY
jgi:hypothetical protein